MTAAVQKDANAFIDYMKALKLPKETEQEQQVRKNALIEASFHAAEIPLEVANTALEVLELAVEVVRLGNKNAITDAATAGVLARAALSGQDECSHQPDGNGSGTKSANHAGQAGNHREKRIESRKQPEKYFYRNEAICHCINAYGSQLPLSQTNIITAADRHHHHWLLSSPTIRDGSVVYSCCHAYEHPGGHNAGLSK
jgi:hypothetical protein